MKIKSNTAVLLATISLGFASPNIYAGSSERASIASNLFKIPSSQTNYDYNPWGNPWPAKNGKCQGYDGGHSGLDIQTKDIIGNRYNRNSLNNNGN